MITFVPPWLLILRRKYWNLNSNLKMSVRQGTLKSPNAHVGCNACVEPLGGDTGQAMATSHMRRLSAHLSF